MSILIVEGLASLDHTPQYLRPRDARLGPDLLQLRIVVAEDIYKADEDLQELWASLAPCRSPGRGAPKGTHIVALFHVVIRVGGLRHSVFRVFQGPLTRVAMLAR